MTARPHLVLIAWQQLAGTTITPKLYNPVALNINMAHTPYNVTTTALRLQPIYVYSQSTVMANLQLQPICGCGQSTVAANLQLRPIYGVRPIHSCSRSMIAANLRCTANPTVAANLWLRPICSYGQSTVVANIRLWPIYSYGQSTFASTLFCDYGLSSH